MLKISNCYNIEESVIYLISERNDLSNLNLNKNETEYCLKQIDDKKEIIHLNLYYKSVFVIFRYDNNEDFYKKIKKLSYEIYKKIKEFKIVKLNIVNIIEDGYKQKNSLSFAEYISLCNYSFKKYFTKKENSFEGLKEINIIIEKQDIDLYQSVEFTNNVIEAVKITKDIVNEPLSYMTAKKLSEEIERLGYEYGFKTEVLEKKQIESLKMGGIIAVNRGSVEPPTFSILKYEPQNAKNEKPIILVGKGIVFDTGGINLKPSGYLEDMKCDKAGAAVVVGVVVAVAKSKLPLKIIALVPATENRPGNNAYVPQDIINMYDGTTVEVLNTDAEGRLILADALSYAKNFEPKFVIDIATLTGAAMSAVGVDAAVILSNCKSLENELINSSYETEERLVGLPLWQEYAEELKSKVADLKNIGGKYGGAITAAKFLEHFTSYDWAHIDIAGPAFIDSEKDYKGVGATGFGVRLILSLLYNYSKEKKSK